MGSWRTQLRAIEAFLQNRHSEHRKGAPAAIDVSAGDQLVGLDGLNHCPASLRRKFVDGSAELSYGARCRKLMRGRSISNAWPIQQRRQARDSTEAASFFTAGWA